MMKRLYDVFTCVYDATTCLNYSNIKVTLFHTAIECKRIYQ